MPARRRSAQLGTLLATLLLASACGTTEPEPLKPMQPEVPADLCATVPAALRQGLIANSNSDSSGNPTAACSLRSPGTAPHQVHAVVTWLQTNDDVSGKEVWDSQCHAIDHNEFTELPGFAAEGADEACAARGKIDGADSATIAAVSNKEVVTVRLSSVPAGKPPAITRAKGMLEGVLGSVAGHS